MYNHTHNTTINSTSVNIGVDVRFREGYSIYRIQDFLLDSTTDKARYHDIIATGAK